MQLARVTHRVRLLHLFRSLVHPVGMVLQTRLFYLFLHFFEVILGPFRFILAHFRPLVEQIACSL